MRGLVIAASAVILTSSGCMQPPSQAPVDTPAGREPASADIEAPAPAATAARPAAAPSAETSPALSQPMAVATTPASPNAAPLSEAPPPAVTPPVVVVPSAAVADTDGRSTAAPLPAAESVAEPSSPPIAAADVLDAEPAAPAESPPPAAASVAPPAPAETPAALALDLAGLEQRLRDTQAIGVFTKLSLKNQVDDLLGQFRAFYRGQLEVQLAELRQRYELLLFKVLTLLQDADRELADAIAASREAIWGILSDPQKLAQI